LTFAPHYASNASRSYDLDLFGMFDQKLLEIHLPFIASRFKEYSIDASILFSTIG
jgi:hypothetical protein